MPDPEVFIMGLLLGKSRSILKSSRHVAACLSALILCVPLGGQQDFLSKPPDLWSEEDALKVLNDSPWAHSVTTSTQDAACGYKNPAIPGEFSAEGAERGELRDATPASISAKPDGAQYLIRWVSAKPVQAAVQRLITLDEKWAAYGQHFERNDPSAKPTDLSRPAYNRNDMITLSVILVRPGPDGGSFVDYAFQDGGTRFPAKGFYMFICAGLKTSNGVVHAGLGGPTGYPSVRPAITLSFPSLIDGKPLITHRDEKVEFRLVAMQRVFETIFTIDPRDLTDGSQAGLYLPTTATDLKENAAPSTDSNQ
jgi:hypothetical protein